MWVLIDICVTFSSLLACFTFFYNIFSLSFYFILNFIFFSNLCLGCKTTPVAYRPAIAKALICFLSYNFHSEPSSVFHGPMYLLHVFQYHCWSGSRMERRATVSSSRHITVRCQYMRDVLIIMYE